MSRNFIHETTKQRKHFSALRFIGILFAASWAGYPNAASGVVAEGECSIAAQVKPKLEPAQEDAATVTVQDEKLVGLAFFSEMKGPGPLEIRPPSSLAGSVASYEKDTLLLLKQPEWAGFLPLCPSDFSNALPAEGRAPFDVGEAPAQQAGRPKRPADPRALVPERNKGIHWRALISQWWLDIGIEQSERILQEAKTRDQLNGKFFKEWFSDVAQYRYGLWNDGDRFFTSYLGHPLQGAVVEGIFWQNDDRVRFSEQDFHSAAYGTALLQAFAFATLDAVQWKLGPVSEASIGHVGLPAHWWNEPYYCNLLHEYCHPRTGLNDLVMNEVGGTVLTIGFQWTDKHVQVAIEKQFHNRAVIDTTRILTNPPASLANLLRFRRPWFRDNRDDANPHPTP